MITGFILIIIHKSLAPPRPELIAASLAAEGGRHLSSGHWRWEDFGEIQKDLDQF